MTKGKFTSQMREKLFPNNIVQILGLLLVSSLLSAPFFIFFDNHSSSLFDYNATLFYCFLCSVILGISYLVNYRRKQKIEWNFRVVNFPYWYLMLFILFIFNVGINSPVNDFFSNKIELQNPITKPYLIVGAVFLGPILEELIFRGVILKGLLTKYTPQYSIIVSAIIFGLIHGKPIQIWSALLIGLFLGWIYYKTRSLGITILLHSFVNLTSLTYDYFLFNFIDSTKIKSIDIFAMSISIPLLYLVTRQLFINMKNYKDEII